MEISVIVTSYNYEPYLESCLRSLINQRFDPDQYEIIIVDDASKDNTNKILDLFENYERIRIIRNKKNIGVAASSNIGIKAALGKYVVRVDADDFVNSEFLNQLHLFYKYNSNYFGVSCDYYYVDINGKKTRRVSSKEFPVSCGILYQKHDLVKYGLYKKSWRHREEEELRKRLGNKYNVLNLPLPLYRYRMHGENKTKQLNHMKDFKSKLSLKTKIRKKYKYSVAIIPARKNSVRLKNKNRYILWGEPLISWTIKSAMNSEYIDEVFVSSDCEKILKIAKDMGVSTIKRPVKLSEDDVPKQVVIEHAVKYICKKSKYKPDVVISLQANSPEITTLDINNCTEMLVNNNINEVMSVNTDGKQNAAIRAMKYNTVFDNKLSTYFQVYIKDFIDIHKKSDIELLEERYNLGFEEEYE